MKNMNSEEMNGGLLFSADAYLLAAIAAPFAAQMEDCSAADEKAAKRAWHLLCISNALVSYNRGVMSGKILPKPEKIMLCMDEAMARLGYKSESNFKKLVYETYQHRYEHEPVVAREFSDRLWKTALQASDIPGEKRRCFSDEFLKSMEAVKKARRVRRSKNAAAGKRGGKKNRHVK